MVGGRRLGTRRMVHDAVCLEILETVSGISFGMVGSGANKG